MCYAFHNNDTIESIVGCASPLGVSSGMHRRRDWNWLISIGFAVVLSLFFISPVTAVAWASSGVSAQAPLDGDGARAADASGRPVFRLGPEDVIEVGVWKHPDLEQEVLVRPDGVIGLKLIGEVAAGGLTLKQLQEYLTTRYRYYVPEAEVSVTLKEMNSFKVYVLGSVNSPGEFKVGSRLSLLQALALAGGFTPYADERHIKVYTEREGREVILDFDFKLVTKGQAHDLFLSPGDRVIVP